MSPARYSEAVKVQSSKKKFQIRGKGWIQVLITLSDRAECVLSYRKCFPCPFSHLDVSKNALTKQ